MGSRIGREKCCASFWLRGYALGKSDTEHPWSDRWTEKEWLDSESHTVGSSFRGLFRAGFYCGRDASNGGPKMSYAEYRAQKDAAKVKTAHPPTPGPS